MLPGLAYLTGRREEKKKTHTPERCCTGFMFQRMRKYKKYKRLFIMKVSIFSKLTFSQMNNFNIRRPKNSGFNGSCCPPASNRLLSLPLSFSLSLSGDSKPEKLAGPGVLFSFFVCVTEAGYNTNENMFHCQVCTVPASEHATRHITQRKKKNAAQKLARGVKLTRSRDHTGGQVNTVCQVYL